MSRDEIDVDGFIRVPLTAAILGVYDRDDAGQPAAGVFVVDADDNVSCAVLLERTTADVLLQLSNDWFRMSLADVELRAIADAIQSSATGGSEDRPGYGQR